MPTAEDLLRAIDDVLSDGARRGVMHQEVEDGPLDGRTITVRGKRLTNFGSCSYLGLETHPALVEAVVDAARRYGSQFSSSRAYLSAPRYGAAEEALTELFGRPAVITTSTTAGHLAALPTLVACTDALLLDHQVHASVQTAAKLARAQGSTVELIPHSNLDVLDRRVRELARNHRRVWYAADGLYSMYADFVPTEGLDELLARHEQLWLYLDDAHSVSWTGRHGRGYVLERLGAQTLTRTVVAASLNKSFAAGGGAILLPDPERRRRLFTVGGPLIFSGPLPPPMLGAVLASARLHLSEELPPRQQTLLSSIRLFNALAAERGLPLLSHSEAPIRCVGAGTPDIAYALTGRLRDAGHFVDTATFPAVPAKRSGARITLTAHHTADDIAAIVDAVAVALPEVLADAGSSAAEVERAFARQLAGRAVRLRPPARPSPTPDSGLRLDHHRSITDLDPAEWDSLLGTRGSFTWDGLHTLEEAFANPSAEPGQTWEFHYWVVRDPADRPVAATFFTTTLWKDDMLSTEVVSAEVERRRRSDPSFLTSTVLAMGSLLTEGNHLFLDRTGSWRTALRMVLRAARAEEDRCGAATIVLRDLPDDDVELHDLLLGEGFVRMATEDGWTRDIDFTDDAGFLAGLPKKARHHQRSVVLGWEHRYDVETIPGGSAAARAVPPADLDHLYELYRHVHARNLGLNVFPLPRRVLDAVLGHPRWELIVLRVDGGPRPVAFVAQHVGDGVVAPVFLGLDYGAVVTHHAYQQALWQAIRSARRHGAHRVLLGLSAGFHKARFGARPHRHWVYVQPTDTFHADLLTHLAEGVQASSRQYRAVLMPSSHTLTPSVAV
ncbi:MAG: aminotransferase class I/II-fold pyridoxal phosphate-dependent enzyme [Actinobacteria bacterium]|nr:aminotransferase class I/II-fold pyridoxal phosphate-dependent enzyme [Actinomycetota bacterium]